MEPPGGSPVSRRTRSRTAVTAEKRVVQPAEAPAVGVAASPSARAREASGEPSGSSGPKRAASKRPWEPMLSEDDYSCPICLNLLVVSCPASMWATPEQSGCLRSTCLVVRLEFCWSCAAHRTRGCPVSSPVPAIVPCRHPRVESLPVYLAGPGCGVLRPRLLVRPGPDRAAPLPQPTAFAVAPPDGPWPPNLAPSMASHAGPAPDGGMPPCACLQ